MYASAGGYRTAAARPKQRSRAQSDPYPQGHVSPPYTIQWPAPARRTTEPMGMNGSPSQRSRNSSVERLGEPFVPPPGSLLAQYQQSGSPAGTSPSTPVSPRSQSPQRSGHQRSSSRQGSIRTPQGPLIKDVPQPPRSALNTPPVIPSPYPHPAGLGHGPGFSVPAQNSPVLHSPASSSMFQGAAMQQQGSYQSGHQQPYASVNQNTSATHLSHPQSVSGGHHPSNSQHYTHHRSRSRPPSAASHRYASSITQPVYGHGSSATLNASRTSLNGNGGATSQRNHHATAPPPGVSASNRVATSSASPPSGLHHRSRSNTRVPPSSTTSTGTSATTAAPTGSKLKETQHIHPEPPRAAKDIHRTTDRHPFPANYDGQTQTRYVGMLLALDDISPLFNILSSFFTWILLAGFVLFPGTFASWQSEPAGTAQNTILSLINHIQLYVIAWICTGIGASGMLWLWWRWQNNYIWIKNRIFVPGLLNSLAGVISTLSSIYGAQAGEFGKSEKSTIIVTGSIALICGVLVLVYQFWFIRNLRLEHDREVGVEGAGKHGEGVLGEKLPSRKRGNV